MYNIGLDIGTGSVGWCLTDNNGHLLKINRKGDNGKTYRNSAWGVRLFASADTAADCRIKRSTRRRYNRRRTRVIELRKIMSEMIMPVDPNFYARLDEAFLWNEDKSDKAKAPFLLFNDKELYDIKYYKKYPTIYHLRKYLLETKEKADPRFIYLALHHMMKYRGHFLYEGQTFEAIDNIKDTFIELEQLINVYVKEKEETEYNNKNNNQYEAIKNCLADNKVKNKDKKENITDIFIKVGYDNKYSKELAAAVLGYEFNVGIIVNDNSLTDEDGKALKAKFADAKYEEQEEKLSDTLGERYYIVEALKKIYSWKVLHSILGDSMFLSCAMVDKYEKHGEQLKALKNLFHKYVSQDEYSEFFHQEKNKEGKYIVNYANYIKGIKRLNNETNKNSNANQQLYQSIKKILDKRAADDEVYKNILTEMEQETFLEKINNVDNSAIPYQLNLIEMDKILTQQGVYYKELKDNKELLLKMLTSKIPYYVGPLNNNNKGNRNFAWMTKKAGKENEKVYPWNVKDVVDIDVTAEDFITRMTNYCTYLPNEKVLPKESLLYQRYMLLEELSQIRIDGKKLSKEDRKAIIDDLFIGKGRVKVSDKDFKEYLDKVNYVKVNGKGYDVTGYQSDDGFACALSSYNKFRRILGYVDERNEKMIEDIIYWLTVFEDKDIVKRKINKQYADKFSDEQLKKILKLKFKGWGRYSAKLLNGIKGDMGTTIIEMLEDADERFAYCEYCPNFMRIINKDAKIKQIIDDNRPIYDGTKDLLEVIQDMHTSPANRRGIWQTMKVIEEIIEYIGEKPRQIYIEFAREDDFKAKNKRTDSRKKTVDKALKKLKKEVVDEYNENVYKELKQYENRLDEEKVYLYFMQNGKSLYTEEKLNLNEPENLEIDHIIPYSLSDDDSLDNKALVLKDENQKKGNKIVKETFLQSFSDIKMINYWKNLKKVGLISEKKYNNLQKNNVDDILTKGFINRQLVETRQIVKSVANLILDYYNEQIDVIEVKASLSTSVRKMLTYEKKDSNGFWEENKDNCMFYKNRDMNDYHHAHDAYLANIIGMYIQKNYPHLQKELNYSQYRKIWRKYYENAKNNNGVNWFATLGKFSSNNEEADWYGQDIIAYMRKIFCYRDVIISKKVEENTGAFYSETKYPREDKAGSKLVPLKQGNNMRGADNLKELDTRKYGGYKGGEKAYFVLVKYCIEKALKKKVKKEYHMEFVEIPVYIARDIKNKDINLYDYVCDILNEAYKNSVVDVEILRNKVPKYQMIIGENGEEYYLVGATEVINSKQFVLGGANQQYNRLLNYIMYGKNDKWQYIQTELLDEQLTGLYDLLLSKIKDEYKGFSKEAIRIQEDNSFYKLDVKNKKEFIAEMIKLVQPDSNYPYLGKYSTGLSDRMGRKSKEKVGKKITLVDKSVTGLYERRTTFELEDDSSTKSR
jgi:CRISPR-associated protein, csn1 family